MNTDGGNGVLRINGTAQVFKRPLGFDPRYIIVDNMTDADAFLYGGIVDNPIVHGTPPLDVIPKHDFKVIIAPAGVRNFTLAVGTSVLTTTPYIKFVLTDDPEYVKQFHQTNLPNVTVEVTGDVGTTSADGGHATIGITTDAEAVGNGSLVAIMKRIRTLLSGALSVTFPAAQAVTVANATLATAEMKPPTATPSNYAVTCTNANQEYSQALPAGTRKVRINARTAVDIRIAWVTGKVATPTDPYMTIKSGTVFTLDDVYWSGAKTVYLASGTAGTVVEIQTCA